MGNSNKVSRRSFLGTSAIGMAGLAFIPSVLNSCKPKGEAALRLGFIGLGQQSMFLLKGFIQLPGVDVVAGCDVYGIKRQRFEQVTGNYYKKVKRDLKVDTYEKYQDLLARPDIDAVVIATPDHWHALIAIDACKAGKDVYLEKPLTFTIEEGKKLRQTVRETNRILAVGSQQRSDPNFQHAVKMVQEGKLGQIQKVHAYVGEPPRDFDLPEEAIPSDLNWDLWLGPNPYFPYNHELNPPISIDPVENEKLWGAWRWYKGLGGGFTTDWGAHMFDIAQWGLGMDESGPVEIIPAGYQDTQFLTYKYANGVIMTEEPFNEQKTKGVKFIGTDGWIEVSRGHYAASDESLKPATKPKPENEEDQPLEIKIPHQVDFIEAVRLHKDPVVPVEIGHRTCTVCNLGNIAYELMRPIQWAPATESFVNDPEAEQHMHRPYREGYSL